MRLPFVSVRLTHGLVACAIAAAIHGIRHVFKFRNETHALQAQLHQVKEELEKERASRKSERAGRIKAEQELRSAALCNTAVAVPEPHSTVYPFKPIGILRSCFSQRNGTPRQPLLVPAARARLELAPDVPPSCLDGLEAFSHCWILYVFHCNTDIAKSLGPNRFNVKGKIRVPRLDGGRCGVLATRSPHRPCPIGLSTAQVLGVSKGVLLLGGADVVDGSPVLDIKPYLPFCDSLPPATAPAWVKEEADDEPLRVGGVDITEAAKQQLERCWGAKKNRSLYPQATDFIYLVQQVLSRDIRSVHQRALKPISTEQAGHGRSAACGGLPDAGASSSGAAVPAAACDADAGSSGVGAAPAEVRAGSSCVAVASAAGASSWEERAALDLRDAVDADGMALGAEAVDSFGGSEAVVEGVGEGQAGSGLYHVVLDGVDVGYNVRVEDGVVQVVSACRAF